MSKAETAIQFLIDSRNCAQAVLAAYAGEFGLEKDKALSVAVGFGAGMGRKQDVCGAVSGAIMALGLRSDFKEADGRPKINAVYEKVHNFIDEFTRQKGTIKCRELLGGCDLSSEEGKKAFKERNLRNCCHEAIRLCCDLLDRQ